MNMTYNVNFYLEYHNIVFSFSHLREPCFSFASNMTESLNFTNESDHLLYVAIVQVKTLNPKAVAFTHVNNANPLLFQSWLKGFMSFMKTDSRWPQPTVSFSELEDIGEKITSISKNLILGVFFFFSMPDRTS